LRTLSKLGTAMYTDMQVQPFSGSINPDGSDGSGLKHKYCLICGSEVWDYLPFDPDVNNFKAMDLNLLTGPFQGSLLNRWTCMLERFEMRIAADGTIPAPEVLEENVEAYDYGEVKINPAYRDAPVGVAWAVGGEAYKYVKIGNPPKDWNGMTMKEFSRLEWNGRVDMTKNVLVPTKDQDDNIVMDTNKRGEYLQLISSLAMGVLPIRRRNIIPILYLRPRIVGAY
jgi:hypothetical protein